MRVPLEDSSLKESSVDYHGNKKLGSPSMINPLKLSGRKIHHRLDLN